MKKPISFSLFLVLLLLSCQGGSSKGSQDRPFAGSEVDVAPPTVGGNIFFTNVTDTSITVNWPAASDNVTPPSQLKYRLVKASLGSSIDTINKVDSITGADVLVDYQANVNQFHATGLSANTLYYFAVVVQDEAGNKALYSRQSQSTGSPAGFSVVSANSTSNTTVTLTFSHAPNSGQANTASNYKIVNGTDPCTAASVLSVSTASLSGSTVTLTTASQSATSYKVCVSNVTRASDGATLTTDSATFMGTGAATLVYTMTSFNAGDSLSTAGITIRCTNQLDNTLSNPGTNIGGSYSGATNVADTSFGVRGLGADGISVLNTSTANLSCSYDGTNPGFIYSIDIPINTTGKSGILVSYNVAQYSDNTREWGVRLQYSTDGGTTFSDVTDSRWDYDSAKAGNVIYTSTNGYSKYGPFLLPAAANNNANVVLRWRYFSTSGTSGNRTRIVLDEIVVDSGGTPDSTAPSAVTLSGTGSGLTMPLSWTSATDGVTPSDNIIYEVHRSTTAGFTPSGATLQYVTLPGKLAYTDTSLIDGTTYYYKVRAIDSSGNASSPSNEVSHTAVNQIVLGSSPYSEDFDNIGTGLPVGWTVRTGATSSWIGDIASFTSTPTLWNTTTGNFRNCASADGMTGSENSTVQNSSSDRALAIRQTGTFGDPGGAFVLQLANTVGKTNFILTFKLQSLDSSGTSAGRTTTWVVDYGIGSNPTTFTPVTTSPAPLTTTQGPGQFSNTTVTANFGNLLDNSNEVVTIRIVTLTSSSGINNRPTTGIDDVSLTFNP